MINAIAQGVAFDFFMDGERAIPVVIVELHLRGVVAGFTVDEITNCGVFDDHFGPERITRETEEISALVGGGFNDDISPAGNDVLGF